MMISQKERVQSCSAAPNTQGSELQGLTYEPTTASMAPSRAPCRPMSCRDASANTFAWDATSLPTTSMPFLPPRIDKPACKRQNLSLSAALQGALQSGIKFKYACRIEIASMRLNQHWKNQQGTSAPSSTAAVTPTMA